MVSINNSLITRFASTQQAAKTEPVNVLSNRYAKPLEQTTSKSESAGSSSYNTPLTYTNPAHRAAISSQRADETSSGIEPPPISEFERMGAAKALVDRYKTVTEAGNRLNLSKAGEVFDLTIKTKDGDTVTLNISADAVLKNENGEASLGNESSFSFVVAGKLSDKERQAIDALINRLGDIAGTYQKDGWADVEFLDVLDGDVITGLNLGVAGEESNTLTIAYSLNPDSSTHTLAVNQNDYEYEINAEAVLASADLALEDNDVFQQYQQILIDTARSYKAGEFSGGEKSMDAVNFFLDGLEAILTPLAPDKTDDPTTSKVEDMASNIADGQISNDKRAVDFDRTSEQEKLPTRQSAIEKDFLSGIPDFFASFNTPRFTPNASNRGEVSRMSLSMEQVTEISVKPGSGIRTVQQHHSYQSVVSQHFGVGRDSVEHANLADVDQPGGQT